MMDVGNLFSGISTDYIDYKNGNCNGYNTAKASAEIAGSWAGMAYGASWGAKLGFYFGMALGGAPVVPCVIIGSAIGGFVWSFGFEWLGRETINMIYGK